MKKGTKSKSKRRQPLEQPASIAYDEKARREFLTGFHKRKVEKKKKKQEYHANKVKEELKEMRRENKSSKRNLIQEDLERIDAISRITSSKGATPEVKTLPTQNKVISVTVTEVVDDDDDLLAPPAPKAKPRMSADDTRGSDQVKKAKSTSSWKVSSTSSSSSSSRTKKVAKR
ncbi:hypothetical protein HDV05_003601 [Chytridiales sp. JEL 0842]|nr:hypothetical protein HDV05_003601 [Chytridiales sp. JEL 0842]